VVNVTISIPDELAERVRDRSHRARVSLNRYIRSVLEREVADLPMDDPLQEIRALSSQLNVKSPEGYVWNREDAYEDA